MWQTLRGLKLRGLTWNQLKFHIRNWDMDQAIWIIDCSGTSTKKLLHCMIDKFLNFPRRVTRQILLLYVIHNYYYSLYGYGIYILLQNSLIYTEIKSNKITDEMIFTVKLFCWIVSFGTCWLVSSWLILCVFDIVKWVSSASDLFLRPFPDLRGFVHEPYA